MLSLLIDLALCAKMRRVAPKNPDKTAFDLAYVENGKEISITGGEGFYVAFRDKDDEKQEVKYLKYNSEILDTRYRVYLDEQEEQDPDCLRLHIAIQNYDNEKPLKFDLGVFADANFKTDQDTLSIALNRRAIQIKSAKENDDSLVMLIVNGSNYPSVNAIYLGELANSDKIDPSKYPFWNNSKEETRNTQDSVFAFSWQNARIQAGDSNEYGFIAVPKAKYSTEPFLYDVTPNLDNQVGEQTLYFWIFDYDGDDNLTLHINLNGRKVQSTPILAYPGVDRVLRSVGVKIHLLPGKEFHYSAYLVDKAGRKSKEVSNTIYSYGAKPPKLLVTNDLQGDYNPKDIIYVEAQVEDENYLEVLYQFDDYASVNLGYLELYDPGWDVKKVAFNVPIPESLKLNDYHILKIWAQDEWKQNSTVFTHRFKYNKPDRPTIHSLYLSDERLEINKEHEVIVYGDGTDPDKGQKVFLYARIDGKPDEKVGEFISTSQVEPFAFFWPIKIDKPGRRNIAFYLQDENNTRSRTESVISVLFYDPKAGLPPAEIGKIIDVSKETIKANSNAAFNLRYFDRDGIGSDMTFNNEGFFAAFRTWTKPKLGYPKPLHVIKYNGTYTSVEEDDFMVSFAVLNDTETGYKRLDFLVRNNQYWPRTFELGIFADSDFSGDDNSVIKMRDDERGFIVTNEAKNIHYTIFTRDVYRSLPVTRHYLAKVKRQGKDEIPANQIPFFASTDTTKTKELRGVNTGYAFSWKYLVPPQEWTRFSALVAAHDKVKTPARVIDNTNVESVEKGEKVNLSFIIRDADPGEDIRFNVTINGNTTSHTFHNDGTPHVHNESFVPNKGYVFYHVIAEDMEEGAKLLSNAIFGVVYVTDVPRIHMNPINKTYAQYTKMRLSGSFDDNENFVSIKYQFSDGELKGPVHNLGWKFDYGQPGDKTFAKTISLPAELTPKDKPYNITVWAEDAHSVKSKVWTQEFIVRPYDPPALAKAGLSKKIVNIGDRILGYASLRDNQKDYVDIYAKVGTNTDYPSQRVLHYDNSASPGKKVALPFYWTVPEVEPGTYDIVFYAVDSEGLDSFKSRTETVLIKARK